MKLVVFTLAAGIAWTCATIPALADAPPFKLTRFDEDYRSLADPDARKGVGDRLKYIALGVSSFVSLGGEWRERFDSIDAPRFGIGASSDSYLLQRLLLHADVHVDDRVRAFVQLGRADAFGKNLPLGASDADRLDVQNAFVDLKVDPAARLTLRLGRQEILFNPTQRFVSVREGPNVRQSFDGVRATWTGERVRVEAIATHPVLYRAGAFDDASDTSQRFYGAYLSHALDKSQSLDFYLLGLDRHRVRFGSISGDERRRSFGARWAGSRGAIDHDLEAVVQTGRFADRDIRAWAVGLVGGYTFEHAWRPRASVGIDAASGDRNGADGRLETFNPMFPKGAYFNESALTSWANLVMLRAGFAVQPVHSLTVSASVFERWRQSGDDAVYVQPYVPIAPTLGNDARRVGGGIQLDVTWRPDRRLTFTGELVHQSAGPAIEKAGGRAVDFAMFIAQARF